MRNLFPMLFLLFLSSAAYGENIRCHADNSPWHLNVQLNTDTGDMTVDTKGPGGGVSTMRAPKTISYERNKEIFFFHPSTNYEVNVEVDLTTRNVELCTDKCIPCVPF